MLIGALFTTISSLPLLGFQAQNFSRWLVYPAACLQGIGIALMLNTATSMISDVIGRNAESAAFVYGAYSFVDKTANGLFLFWLIANYSASPAAL